MEIQFVEHIISTTTYFFNYFTNEVSTEDLSDSEANNRPDKKREITRKR